MGTKRNVNVCPNCSSIMEKKLAPFKYHGMYIGMFDAYVCPVCHRTYFTENAYKEIMDMPLDFHNYTDFSDEVNMPPVRSFSIFIILEKRKPQTNALTEENGLLEVTTDQAGYKENVTEAAKQEVS